MENTSPEGAKQALITSDERCEPCFALSGLPGCFDTVPRASLCGCRRFALPWADLWLPLRGEKTRQFHRLRRPTSVNNIRKQYLPDCFHASTPTSHHPRAWLSPNHAHRLGSGTCHPIETVVSYANLNGISGGGRKEWDFALARRASEGIPCVPRWRVGLAPNSFLDDLRKEGDFSTSKFAVPKPRVAGSTAASPRKFRPPSPNPGWLGSSAASPRKSRPLGARCARPQPPLARTWKYWILWFREWDATGLPRGGSRSQLHEAIHDVIFRPRFASGGEAAAGETGEK